MPTPDQQACLQRKCAAAAAQAIDAFPNLLAECTPDQAAAIIADLIKVQLARSVPEHDSGAELIDIINRINAGEDVPHHS